MNTFVVPDPHCGGELNDANWIHWWVVQCPKGVDKAKAYRDGQQWAKAHRALEPDIENDYAAYRKWYDDAPKAFRQGMGAMGYKVKGPYQLNWIGTL